MAGEATHDHYRAWLLRRPCACSPCVLPVVIHHSTIGETEQHSKSLGGRRGKGQRASDTEGISVCNRHHANFHDLRGYFQGWEKQALRDWQNKQVAELRAAYEAEFPNGPPVTAKARATGTPRAVSGDGWTAGANAERARIAELLRNASGSPYYNGDQAHVLADHAELLEQHDGPLARRR